MESSTGRILKSDDVKLEGLFRLEIGQTPIGSVNKGSITSAPVQVCIVENHPEFAVMEVTCGCGTKIRIKCEYTEDQSAVQQPEQKNNGENNNANQ